MGAIPIKHPTSRCHSKFYFFFVAFRRNAFALCVCVCEQVDWSGSSAFAGYLSGFLNVQIEHHMAPQMPMENLRKVPPPPTPTQQQLPICSLFFFLNFIFPIFPSYSRHVSPQRLLSFSIFSFSLTLSSLEQIRGDCKALAKQFNLPYREMSFFSAVKLMLGGLWTTGREELARRKSYVGAASAVLDKIHAD
jgi:hypothetical protein